MLFETISQGKETCKVCGLPQVLKDHAEMALVLKMALKADHVLSVVGIRLGYGL